jgi:hypothetical protein
LRFAAILLLITLAACHYEALGVALEHEGIRAIATIHRAETEFYARYGRFAEMSEMSEIPPENTGGYRFHLNVDHNTYAITATPSWNGLRSFFSDQTLVIRQSTNWEPANANSPEIK